MSHLIKGSKGRGTDQVGSAWVRVRSEGNPLHFMILGKWVGHPTFTSSTQGIRVMN